MKRLFVLLLPGLLLSGLSGAPQRKNTGKAPKLAPPPIVTSFSDERPQVRPTGEFSEMPMPAPKGKKKGKSDTTAALLSVPDRDFVWKPSKLSSSAIGTADLTGADLSADGTLLVISERVGGEGKANSTRLIFLDIQEEKLAGGFLIPERHLSAIRFIEKSPVEILALRHPFEPYKVTGGLVRINLKTRKITDQTAAPPGTPGFTSFAQCGKKLICTAEGSDLLYEYALDDLAAGPVKIKTGLTAPRVCACGGGIAAFSSEGIRFFDYKRGKLAPSEQICKAPEGFTPRRTVMIDAAIPAIVFAGGTGESFWYFRGGTFRRLAERGSGVAFFNGKNRFYAGMEAGAKIVTFQMPEGRETGRPNPINALKPSTRNSTLGFFHVPALKESFLLLDSRANLFLVDPSRSRWKKSIVFAPDRNAFR